MYIHNIYDLKYLMLIDYESYNKTDILSAHRNCCKIKS